MEQALPRTPKHKTSGESLKKLLMTNTKDVLLEIGNRHDAPVRKSYNKTRLTDILTETIEEKFLDFLAYCGKDGTDLLQRLLGTPTGEPFSPKPEEAHMLTVFAQYGYLYVQDTESGLHPVMPVELADSFNKALMDKTYQQLVSFHQQLNEYTIALVRLYGVYKVHELVNVWNKHQSEPLTEEKAINFLKTMDTLQPYYQFQVPYIRTAGVVNEEKAEEFYRHLEKVPCYIPDRKEIQLQIEAPFNQDSPEFAALRQFVHSKGLDKPLQEQVLQQLTRGAVTGSKPESLFRELISNGLTFDSAEDIQEFSSKFKNYAATTRNWNLRGFTMKERQQMQQDLYKNVGRNQPCPCGSGKKFKKCHGR